MLQSTIELEGDEGVTLDDMGEGYLILTQRCEAGVVHRLTLGWEQLVQAINDLAPRYGAKNTDRSPVAAVM